MATAQLNGTSDAGTIQSGDRIWLERGGFVFSLMGSTLLSIATGTIWYKGSGVPSDGTGRDGDLYLRTNGDVYEKASGSWGDSSFSLLGPPGPEGKGFDLSIIESFEIQKGDLSFTVDKASTASAYVVGMYVLLVNSDGWMYGTITSYSGTAMTVTVTATKGTSGEPSAVIIQPASAPGSQWLTGSGVPDSSLGNDGDLYIDTASTNFTTYAKAAGSWS